jgi:hypothetical protein
MTAVNIVIPSFNGRELLPVCLDSLKKQTFADFDVTVVDNGSQDGSIAMLRERYPDVKIVALERNYGFAMPVNRGIESGEAEFVSLLNNDIELDPRWLEELHSALRLHPEAASCGPKMMRYWERDRINVLGIRLNSDGDVEIIGAGETDRGQYDDLRYVFGVNAGACLYRRSLFADIGLFDESFWASFEDVDLSFRAQLAGYKALYVPTAVAYHMVGATIKKRRYRPTFLNNRNKILFFWKDMPTEMIRDRFWTIAASRSARFFKRLLFNFYKVRTLYFLVGTLAACARLPYVLRERKKVQAGRRVTVEYLRSIMDKDFV